MLKATFRSYSPNNRNGCRTVFDGISPTFFAASEREEFLEFIDDTSNAYWVLGDGRQIIGCGGYGFRDRGDTADLCWGIIASDQHGKRLGEYLMTARLIEVLNNHEIQTFRVATSQHTEAFFEKYGFTTEQRIQNGFAEGLDRIEMKLVRTSECRKDLHRKWKSVRRLVDTISLGLP